jgi:hypothetical protein
MFKLLSQPLLLKRADSLLSWPLLRRKKATALDPTFTTLDQSLLNQLLNSSHGTDNHTNIVYSLKNSNFNMYLLGQVSAKCMSKPPILIAEQQSILKMLHTRLNDQGFEGNLKRWISKKLPDVLGYVISSALVYPQKLGEHGLNSYKTLCGSGFCKVEIVSDTTTTFTAGAHISYMPISNVTFELPENSVLDNNLPPVPRNPPMSTSRQSAYTTNSKDDKVLSVAPSNQNFQPLVELAGNNQMPGSPPLQPVTSVALFRPDDPPKSVTALSDSDDPLTVTVLFCPTTVGNNQNLGEQF